MESLRADLPEFRRAQALGYPLAGMVCLIIMAMATGVRQGPEDCTKTATKTLVKAVDFRSSFQGPKSH